MEKSCDNCILQGTNMLCKPYCIDFSSHQYTCKYCIHLTPDTDRFCEMDDGDDGMSCCGESFELNPKL